MPRLELLLLFLTLSILSISIFVDSKRLYSSIEYFDKLNDEGETFYEEAHKSAR